MISDTIQVVGGIASGFAAMVILAEVLKAKTWVGWFGCGVIGTVVGFVVFHVLGLIK